MKKNIKRLICAGFILGGLLTSPSCKYLDSDAYIEEVNHLNEIWGTRKDIRATWATCFGFIPNFTDMAGFWPFPGSGDEGYAGRDQYTCLAFAQGKMDADNQLGLNYWEHFYKAIRVCNTFLEKSGQANDNQLAEGEVEGYQNDVRFIRAYYYSLMLELYGPFVIVDHTIDYSSTDLPTTRATYEECVKFIIDELDGIISKLPDFADQLNSDFGRPNKAVAMAVKARVLLVAASPLVNGNADYLDFKTMEGTPFFSVYDVNKWKLAADAYKAIIDLNQYELFTVPAEAGVTVPLGDFEGNNVSWPNGPAGIDPYLSYKNLFAAQKGNYWNSEAIWQVNFANQTQALTQLGFPRGHKQSDAIQITQICASQELVDAFFMNNGNTITEEDHQLYSDLGPAATSDGHYVLGDGASNLSPIHTNWLKGQAVPAPPSRCLNREARFYATIGFHGKGYKQDDNGIPYYYVDYRAQTADGYIQTDRPSVRTGYNVSKWVGEDDTRSWGSSAKQFPVIRLAEVYLGYAEALNESQPGDPHILTYLNIVRFRAGLPGYKSGSQEEIRNWIKQERFVEFAFEGGKRYFDSRRWKDADNFQRDSWGNTTGMSGALMGCNFQSTDGGFYDRYAVDGYIFKKRNYFLPLPYGEVANHWGELVQNPGW